MSLFASCGSDISTPSRPPNRSLSRRIPSAALGLWITATLLFPSPSASEVLTNSTPFVSPKGDYVTQRDRYHAFRIPGMTVTRDGSVPAFAEGRRGDGGDP